MPANPTCSPSGLCDTIRFQIVSNAADLTALSYVTALPPGFALSDVFGADPLLLPSHARITVVDPLGCYFNEPVGTMLGREGWAKLMLPTAPTAQTNGYYQEQWEVFALCCNTGRCA